jgi:predicted flavoprotein YhiN
LQLAIACKALPIKLGSTRPIDEAISTAGGVRFDAMTRGLMLNQIPGVFCAGEMLDWEAPTGGYLLTTCLASGKRAAEGVLAHLKK